MHHNEQPSAFLLCRIRAEHHAAKVRALEALVSKPKLQPEGPILLDRLLTLHYERVMARAANHFYEMQAEHERNQCPMLMTTRNSGVGIS